MAGPDEGAADVDVVSADVREAPAESILTILDRVALELDETADPVAEREAFHVGGGVGGAACAALDSVDADETDVDGLANQQPDPERGGIDDGSDATVGGREGKQDGGRGAQRDRRRRRQHRRSARARQLRARQAILVIQPIGIAGMRVTVVLRCPLRVEIRAVEVNVVREGFGRDQGHPHAYGTGEQNPPAYRQMLARVAAIP